MATWSGIRNKLEKEYLAECLRGHIQYFVTTYRESHDQVGRASIRYDGEEIIKGAYYCKNNKPIDNLPDELLIDDNTALKSGFFCESDFYEAFDEFDNQSIDLSLNSDNLLVRIFAVLDKRIGKRRLLAMRDTISQEPEMFVFFYNIRVKAEGLL